MKDKLSIKQRHIDMRQIVSSKLSIRADFLDILTTDTHTLQSELWRQVLYEYYTLLLYLKMIEKYIFYVDMK